MGDQILTARPGSQAPDPSSFLGLRLPRPTPSLLLKATQAWLTSRAGRTPVRRAAAQDVPPQLSSGHHALAPSPARGPPGSNHPVANFGASAAVGHVVPASFSQTKSPVDPTLSQHQNHPEQRGHTQSSDQPDPDDLFPRRPATDDPRPLRQESPCPSAQSISSGEPVKRGHASTIALPQEATGKAGLS